MGECRRESNAGWPQPMVRWKGPVVGAAPDRTRLRGEIRSPAGRSVSSLGGVPAMAAGSRTGRLHVRATRGDDALRVGEGLLVRIQRLLNRADRDRNVLQVDPNP